jgi:hypothetical protein
MMATTHLFVGLAIASGVAVLAPEYAVVAAIGAVVGGLAPDIDIVATHRKTLHFPVYYAVLSIPAVILALLRPGVTSVGVALFSVAAAAHSLSDVIGNGPDPRPWANPTSRAVYLHPTGRWVRARRWIRYDGAPEDFLLGLAMAVPALLVYRGNGLVQAILGIGIAVSFLYTLFRKPIGRRIDRRADS